MARIAIAVTKRVSFRGANQEFSNVYHYNDPLNTGPPYAALVSEVVGVERNLHSTDVTFVRAKAWTAGGTPSQNQMQYEVDLTGTGNQVTSTTMDRERAVLVRWPAGFDSRGKPVYLRKWFHSCGGCGGVTMTNDVLKQIAGFTDTERNNIATQANNLRIIGTADEWLLCAKSGRVHTGPGEAHRFLEHRQLGDMWR